MNHVLVSLASLALVSLASPFYDLALHLCVLSTILTVLAALLLLLLLLLLLVLLLLLLLYIYLTNRFHVAVRLFSNRSQMTSKCGKNKKVAHEAIAECVTECVTECVLRLNMACTPYSIATPLSCHTAACPT